MTTPDAPQEEAPKEASNGPLFENLKAPVNVTKLSALSGPTDELERDFLWIENVQEFIHVRDYEFIREAFITALQLPRLIGMIEKADALLSKSLGVNRLLSPFFDFRSLLQGKLGINRVNHAWIRNGVARYSVNQVEDDENRLEVVCVIDLTWVHRVVSRDPHRIQCHLNLLSYLSLINERLNHRIHVSPFWPEL